MSQKPILAIANQLMIIWTIAWKDILDALKNRVVFGMAVVLSLTLLLPKLLPFVFEQSVPVVPVFVVGGSSKLDELNEGDDFLIQPVRSQAEFRRALCSALFPEIGLYLPAEFDQLVETGQPIELQGYACWGKRHQVEKLRPGLEESLSQWLELTISIQLEGNVFYPPDHDLLFLGMAALNSVMMILMMGMFLVPNLIYEEKQTKTMQALLLSPASIGQVVAGKALVGVFYILVTAIVVFLIFSPEVVHWSVVALFVAAGAVFSVAVGLALGSFFERQQDAVGVMTILLLLLIGAIIAEGLNVPLPGLLENLLPWAPSVALANICWMSFSESFLLSSLAGNLLIILVVSIPLYALVIWKIKRSDR